jgi:hypothetical protein
MTERTQTSAVRGIQEQLAKEEARRRPLVQYVITQKTPMQGDNPVYTVEQSAAGTKPSHWLIDPPQFLGSSVSLEQIRRFVPAGYKRLDRRKDDRVDVVEVWV